MSGPRIGELFSGYGGLGAAVKDVYGGSIIWHSDIDKGACKILAHRFPDVPNLGDITSVDWSQVEPVDILTGGSPCQDLSHAGKRQGMTEGTRSNLWVAMREAIAVLRPSTVIWENVAGANSAAAVSEVEQCPGCMGDPRLTGPPLRALGRVLGDLSDLGYDCRGHALRAADVGAPHGRLRWFVVATDAQHAQLERVRQLSGLRWGHDPRPDVRMSGLRPDLSLLPTPTTRDHKGHNQRRDDTCLTGALLPTPAVNDMGEGKTPDSWDAWTDDMRARHGNGHGKSLAIEAQRLLPTPTDVTKGGGKSRSGARAGEALINGIDRLLPTPMVGDAASACNSTATRHKLPPTGVHAGDTLTDVIRGAQQWGDYAAAIARWEHVLGRAAPPPTMTSAKGNPQLSPAFVEWMQGLPAGWVTGVPGITRNEALKALGNGVVPQQAAAALRTMLAWEVAA